jgi:hypothetical protein
MLRFSHALIFLVAGVTVGCGQGDGLPREPIRGIVTLDGRPLESGTIALMPADTSGAATAVGAAITHGSYDVPRASGPVPGTYSVAISSPEQEPAKSGTQQAAHPGDGGEPVVRDRVPSKFNTRTTLKAEVKKGDANVFDFPLTSK